MLKIWIDFVNSDFFRTFASVKQKTNIIMKKYNIILVLGMMVGNLIVVYSSNVTTLLPSIGQIIGMLIIASTCTYYGCKRMKEHYKNMKDKQA